MARGKISKEDVVEKLKDDGDFDLLRLNIIRRLKDNEELRNKMISLVKESAALNRPSAQTMKPRQLSDAIFEDVGYIKKGICRSKMLSQLSDGLWGLIRSEDGMKGEIRETVQSVYATLSTREAGRKMPAPVSKGETSSSFPSSSFDSKFLV
ncbi:PREDICTED: uncharacterized protein LOC106345008 [Brassica oleracea var. oleracea]|uniref:uncharacterized protein LOC106345008 n=1 Tax=Brassica oleracea var. oleracea TaxID=109376 RepID=UPI0006A6B920|nr:PREDICTED: uncharacterized protein LOC106345008 [Brassica oleracea var. oleracea]